MPKQSAGILLYRHSADRDFEVLIVRPGGPFWAKKDLAAWSIPKGEFPEGEEPLAAAKREFQEETGLPAPAGDYQSLGTAKQPSGKIVHAFALAGELDLKQFRSNKFEMEWPPRSGTKQEFSECDRAAWTALAVAKQKLVKGQVPLLEALAIQLSASLDSLPAAPKQASLF